MVASIIRSLPLPHHDGVGRPCHDQLQFAFFHRSRSGFTTNAVHPPDFDAGTGPWNGMFEIDNAADAA